MNVFADCNERIKKVGEQLDLTTKDSSFVDLARVTV